MPPIGYCFLKWTMQNHGRQRAKCSFGLKLPNFCVLTLIFVRSLETMVSSGQLHPLPADHSSSLSDFPNLLTHGHNGSFMELSLKSYSSAGTQPCRFIPYCNKTFSYCAILPHSTLWNTGPFATNEFQVTNREASDLQWLLWVWPCFLIRDFWTACIWPFILHCPLSIYSRSPN